MTRVVTIFIVLALVGGPIEWLSCDGRCQIDALAGNGRPATCAPHGNRQPDRTVADTCSLVFDAGLFSTATVTQATPTKNRLRGVASAVHVIEGFDDRQAFSPRQHAVPRPSSTVAVLRI